MSLSRLANHVRPRGTPEDLGSCGCLSLNSGRLWEGFGVPQVARDMEDTLHGLRAKRPGHFVAFRCFHILILVTPREVRVAEMNFWGPFYERNGNWGWAS